MQLKSKYNTRDEIPAEHQEFYIERDGAWHIDVQGVVDAESADQRLAELSAEHNALTAERDALLARVDELQHINQGAGALGSGDARPFNNPFRKDSFNLTRQGEIWRKDPARARALQAAAR